MNGIKILCLCDAPSLTTGFARVASNLMRRWAAAGAVVDVWGIGYQGWPFRTQCPYVNEMFPGGTGRQLDHWAGPSQLELFLAQLAVGGYTHVWILQDTFQLVNWNFPVALKKICTAKNIRSALYFPVDAPLDPEWTDILAAVDVPIAFTEFGRVEAALKMAARSAQVAGKADFAELDYSTTKLHDLPHGVDTEIFKPLPNRAELRKNFWAEPFVQPNDFLMVNVNVNQRRKDVARSLEILKGLIDEGVPAKLVMHMHRRSDDGLDLEQVAAQLGLRQNVDWAHHDHLFVSGQGKFTEEKLVQLYNIADLYLTTTLGEGWGLGITEALACGTPVAVPEHTSCGEIARKLKKLGHSQCLVLPVEPGGLFQGMDNSRQRRRASLLGSVNRILQTRSVFRCEPLNADVRRWLSWDRIAAEMLNVMG